MAPQAILELVDGKRDMQFCMTARKVARSSILGTKWLSESTKNAMHRVFQFRGQVAIKEFDQEVERQKALLLREDKIYEYWRRKRENKPLREIEDRIDERSRYTTSVHNKKQIRELEKRVEEKRRRDAYVSEEEKKAEYDKQVSVLNQADGVGQSTTGKQPGKKRKQEKQLELSQGP